jgi:hypothetical protein
MSILHEISFNTSQNLKYEALQATARCRTAAVASYWSVDNMPQSSGSLFPASTAISPYFPGRPDFSHALPHASRVTDDIQNSILN